MCFCRLHSRPSHGYKLDQWLPKIVAQNHSLCGITGAFLAGFDSTGKLLATPNLNQNEFPSFVENFLYVLRNVDDLVGGNDFIITMDIPVKQLIEPESVLFDAILVEVGNFGQMLNLTFATQRSQRACVGMHGSENDPGVLNLALYIFRSIIPVYTDSFDRCCEITLRVQKLHDARQIIRFSGRFANEIGVV